MPDPRKGRRRPRRTWLAAVLPLGVTLGVASVVTATAPGQEAPPAPAVLFELKEPRASGVVEPGTPLQLEIQLTGLTPLEKDGVVAIIEGEPFVRRLVPMRLNEESKAFHSLVTLEPDSAERPEVPGRAVRLSTTVARLQGMRLEPIVTRVVYVTTQLPAGAATVTTAPVDQVVQELSLEFTEERLDPRAPLNETDGTAFSEEDIIPNPLSAEAQAYWRQVSERIGQTWRQPSPLAPARDATRGVGVRFRLHANGEAQLIQIERSSGVPEVDEAGLKAVLEAHPFPPFPPDVSDDAVDMHIELGQAPGLPSTSSEQNGSPDAPASGRP